MPRIFALFCAMLMMGCSTAVFSSSYAEAGAGGQDATGGASAACSSSGGVAGSLVSSAGATGHAGSPAGGAGGETSTGGAGGSAGALAGSVHVDVVPGVVTDCVFPSDIVLPPPVPDTCVNIHTSTNLCMQCAGDCTLPYAFSDYSWDYSTLTLTFTVTLKNNGIYPMLQGACGGVMKACDYQVNMPATFPVKIVFQKTDRGYVAVSGAGLEWGSTSESCSTDTGFLNQMQCLNSGWLDYWYNVTIPCAK
jgi:hypothetical protein